MNVNNLTIILIFAGFIFLYFLGAYTASAIAAKKGQSGCLFFILSVFISPIFTIIIALLLKDRLENK